MNKVVNQEEYGWLWLYTKKNPKRVFLIIFACLSFLILLSLTEFYSSEPIRGRVVDSKTKQPIEGAIVMADWLVVGSEGRHVQYLAVKEAITDKKGNFVISGWGPKLMSFYLNTVVRNKQPTIRIYKEGYVPVVKRNGIVGINYGSLFNRISVTFNGETSELEPFHGSIEEYVKKMENLEVSMIGFYGDTISFCAWRFVPNFLIAMDKQASVFRRHKIYTGLLPLISIGSKNCGNASEVFKEYLHEK